MGALAAVFPTLLDFPVLDRDDFNSDQAFLNARALHLATFVPDACDPMPAPQTALEEGGNLPSGATTFPQDPGQWPCLNYTQGCSTTTKNKITINPRTSPTVVAAGGSQETVGLRWCDCKDTPSFGGSVTSRAKCRNDFSSLCEFDEDWYGNNSASNKWLKLRTKHASSGWTTPDFGKEWLVNAGGAAFPTYWDFTALGAFYMETSTNYAGVKGMLWTHVASLSNASVPIASADLKRFANSLSSGSASASFGPQGQQWAAINDWYDCPMCVSGVAQVVYEAGNPWWKTATPSGPSLVEVADSATRAHFDAVGAGTRRHVPGSEPVSWLSTALTADQSVVRSVGLASNGTVLSKLVSTGFDKLPVAEALSAPGGPTLVRDEGLAFSVSEQRLYVLGGFAAGNVQKNDGWMLDLANNQWRQCLLPAGETVGTVLAMAYRRQDRSIYFVDKTGSTLRLRRWNAQRKLTSGVIVTLATFPSSWNAFGKYAVVPGTGSDLALVAWAGTGSEKTRFGRFTLSTAHRITMAGLSKLTTSIVGPPTLTADRFAYSSDPVRPTASQLLVSSMPAASSNDAPTIIAH